MQPHFSFPWGRFFPYFYIIFYIMIEETCLKKVLKKVKKTSLSVSSSIKKSFLNYGNKKKSSSDNHVYTTSITFNLNFILLTMTKYLGVVLKYLNDMWGFHNDTFFPLRQHVLCIYKNTALNYCYNDKKCKYMSKYWAPLSKISHITSLWESFCLNY